MKKLFLTIPIITLICLIAFSACKKGHVLEESNILKKDNLKKSFFIDREDILMNSFLIETLSTELRWLLIQYQEDNLSNYLYLFREDEQIIRYGYSLNSINFTHFLSIDTYEETWNEFETIEEVVDWLEFRLLNNSNEAIIFKNEDNNWIVIIEQKTYTWEDFFTEEDMLSVVQSSEYWDLSLNIYNLMTYSIENHTEFCEIFNGYYTAFLNDITISLPQLLGKEDYLYLLLDAITEESEEGGLCYGNCHCSENVNHKWSHTFCRKACRLDKLHENHKISEEEYCDRMNVLIDKYNEKNGYEVRPHFIC